MAPDFEVMSAQMGTLFHVLLGLYLYTNSSGNQPRFVLTGPLPTLQHEEEIEAMAGSSQRTSKPGGTARKLNGVKRGWHGGFTGNQRNPLMPESAPVASAFVARCPRLLAVVAGL